MFVYYFCVHSDIGSVDYAGRSQQFAIIEPYTSRDERRSSLFPFPWLSRETDVICEAIALTDIHGPINVIPSFTSDTYYIFPKL